MAIGSSLLDAYDRAYSTDPESAFGGIIAFNQELDGETASVIVERQFVEVVIAPEVDEAAVEVARRKKNVRLLSSGPFGDRLTPVPLRFPRRKTPAVHAAAGPAGRSGRNATPAGRLLPNPPA